MLPVSKLTLTYRISGSASFRVSVVDFRRRWRRLRVESTCRSLVYLAIPMPL